MNKKYRRFVVIAITLALAILFLPSLSTAPVYADLPTRPEDEPAAEPPTGRKGAGIALSVTGATSSYGAVVQWQDGLGDWHDIDGWRGQVEDDHVLWFVSEALFDSGPFRWQIYDGKAVLGTSELFTLPGSKGELVRVNVTIK